MTIDNRAIAGRSLKSFFDEGRWQSILDDAKSGDYVIIQFGHNDGAYNKPERYISHEDFAAMLREEYISPAREKGLNVVLATQTQSHWFNAETGVIDEPGDEVSYASLLREAASEMGLPLLEINNLSRALENEMGEEESRALHLYAEAGEYEKYPEGVQDNTHFSYVGAFEIARIAAEELCQIDDLARRRADEYSLVVEFEGEQSFDVRQYGGIGDRFRVAVKNDGGVNLTINGETVLTHSIESYEFVTECSAVNGKISVVSDEPVTVEVTPIWHFEPEGGINTAEAEYYAEIPAGVYGLSFTKSDTERGNIYVNSLLVGANVDMYGTVAVPEGTHYEYKGFETEGGASIKVDQRTSSLKAFEAAKTPSIFERKTRIYVAGDSTLCNYYPVIPETVESEIAAGTVRTGWGQLLDRFVSDEYEVVNLASSGDWARDWMECIFPTVLAQGKSGDILIIQFGINDRNRDDGSHETMKTALTTMIEGCREKGIIPILVKPQPSVGYSWGSAGENEAPNGNNGGFFDAVTEVAEETGCEYVDLYALAGTHFAQVGRSYVAQNYQLWDYDKNEPADKLHISFAGAKKICSLFCEGAAGLISCDGYYEVTEIEDEVYTLKNGDKVKIFNDSGEFKRVEIDGEEVLIAPYGKVRLNV